MEIKQCPGCKYLMIKRDSPVIKLSYPPIIPRYWQCGCGHTEDADEYKAKTDHESFMEAWAIVNRTKGEKNERK